MKIAAIQKAVGLFSLGLAAAFIAQAQPMYDRVNVNLPYSVTVGQKTLPPGDYTFQQLPSASGDSRIVLVYSDNGMKFQTSAMSIPTLDPNTARDTKLILDQEGNNYYLDKIWVQGKDYGYEFPVPNNVKSHRKEMQQASLPARSTSSTTAEATPPAESTPSAAPPPATTTPTETAQTTPPAQETPQPMQPATPSTPQTTPTPAPTTPSEGSADRAADTSTDTDSMPHTSAGWLMALLSGGALSGAGLVLRRRR